QRPAVVACAGPVAVGNLRDDIPPFLERLEHHADVEGYAERALHPDLDVVEIDEYRNLQSCICQNPFQSVLSGLIAKCQLSPARRRIGSSSALISRGRRRRRSCPDRAGRAYLQTRSGGSTSADCPS